MRINIKGFIQFILLFGLNILMWSFFHSYFNFLIGIIMILTAILSVSITIPLAKKIECRIQFPTGLVAMDTEFDIHILFHNPVRWWMFFAELHYDIYNKFTGDYGMNEEYSFQDVLRNGKCLNVIVFPGKDSDEKIQVQSSMCGAVVTSFTNLYVNDILHLVQVKVDVKQNGCAMVYPLLSTRETESAMDLIAGFSREAELSRKGADYNPDYEIREYVPGDDLKAIHWKLSAKQDALMVRERMASGHEKVNVVFEMDEDTKMNQQLIHSLQDVCHGFLSENYPVELFWWSNVQNQGRNQLILEQGELENIICEILSVEQSASNGKAVEYLQTTRNNSGFVRITAGQWKGEYVQKVS